MTVTSNDLNPSKVTAKKSTKSKQSRPSSSLAIEGQALNWRMDAEQSFSDWTLEVAHAGAKTVDIYHVHKCVLAVGSRGSAYFATLFQQQMRENANNSSRIELDESEAKLFPYMLDYVYLDLQTDRHDLTWEQLFELCHLAEYFQNPGLQRYVAPKAAGLISMKNAINFLAHAKTLQDPSLLLDEASKNLGKNLARMPVDVASQLEPTFFLKVLNVFLGHLEVAHSLPELILRMTVACLEENQESLSAEVFNELSSRQQVDLELPDLNKIHVRNVLKLLAMESRFLTPGENSLSPLQTRFMSSVMECRHESRRKIASLFQSKEECHEEISKLPHFLVLHLFTDTVWENKCASSSSSCSLA